MGTNDSNTWTDHLSLCFWTQSYILVQFMEVSFSFRAPNQGEESTFLHSVLKWMQNSRVSHHHKLAASLVTARLQKNPSGKVASCETIQTMLCIYSVNLVQKEKDNNAWKRVCVEKCKSSSKCGQRKKAGRVERSNYVRKAFQLWPVLRRMQLYNILRTV